jgi:predicted DNA-binding protein (MmcQ/YjbR family)
MGKMFALTDLVDDFSLNLKCDPERAVELRDRYPAIRPGFHMNKTHWNTVEMDGSLPQKLVLELIDHSYQLVKAKMKPLPFSGGEGSRTVKVRNTKELKNE